MSNHYQVRLFHGTPVEIHNSARPFLDPRRACGNDVNDPKEGHVFASSSLAAASTFTLKNTHCKSIAKTTSGIAAIYEERPPQDAGGWVYEVTEHPGFRQSLLEGTPLNKWVMLASDMPLVTDIDGSQVPGLPVSEPVRRVTVKTLIAEDGLRLCEFTNTADRSAFRANVLSAFAEATSDTDYGPITSYIGYALSTGWLLDVTPAYL